MDPLLTAVRERMTLVAINPMRIAGLQGVYGDPCGIEFVPVSPAEGLCLNQEPIVLIDAGSVTPLFELLFRFRRSCPDTQIIVIGTDADDTYIECVIAAGARGFIPANALADSFIRALDDVRSGSIWAPRKVLSRLIGRHSHKRETGQHDAGMEVQLTPREAEVLSLLLGGQGNREIGVRLGIDPGTVKAHLARIMRKAGVANRIELTVYALHHLPNERRGRANPRDAT